MKKGKIAIDKGGTEKWPIQITVFLQWEDGLWSVIEKIETNEENIDFFKERLAEEENWIEWERPVEVVFEEFKAKELVQS